MRVLFATTLILFIAIYPSAYAVPKDDFLTYVKAQEHKAEYRKFAYLASQLLKTNARYDKNRKLFPKYRPKDGSVVGYLSKQDALNNKRKSLIKYLDNDSSEFELMLLMMPNGRYLGYAKDTLRYLVDNTNTEFPEMSFQEMSNTIEMAYSASEKNQVLRKELAKAFKHWFGVKLDTDFENTDVVRQAKVTAAAISSTQDKDQFTEAEFAKFKEIISNANNESVRNQRIAQEEVSSGFGILSMGANLAGDKQLAAVFSISARNFELLNKLSNDSIGPLTFVHGYLGVIQAFAGIGANASANQTLSVMSFIDRRLKELQRHIDIRFDYVDLRLKQILQLSYEGFSKLHQEIIDTRKLNRSAFRGVINSLDAQQNKLNALSYSVNRLSNKIDELYRNEIQRELNIAQKEFVLNATSASLAKLLSILHTLSTHDAALKPYVKGYIYKSKIDAEKIPTELLSPDDNLEFPSYIDFIFPVGTGLHVPSSRKPGYVNFAVWAYAAQSYANVIRDNWVLGKHVDVETTQEILQVGEYYLNEFQSLYFNKEILQKTLHTFLENYKAALAEFIQATQEDRNTYQKDHFFGLYLYGNPESEYAALKKGFANTQWQNLRLCPYSQSQGKKLKHDWDQRLIFPKGGPLFVDPIYIVAEKMGVIKPINYCIEIGGDKTGKSGDPLSAIQLIAHSESRTLYKKYFLLRVYDDIGVIYPIETA